MKIFKILTSKSSENSDKSFDVKDMKIQNRAKFGSLTSKFFVKIFTTFWRQNFENFRKGQAP